jgi:hypothetical protein
MPIQKRGFKSIFLIILFSLFTSANTFAHHGSVVNPKLYLAENLIELEGEIIAVFWRSPHPRFRLKVLNEDSEEIVWELELNGNPISYRRQGLTADNIARLGDKVKVAGYISKADTESMGVLHMLLTNGQEFVNGRNRELRWSTVRLSGETVGLDPIVVKTAREEAQGIFRVWGSARAPDIAYSMYGHLLTDVGQELAAAYDPVADNYELECRQGMPDTMFDRGSPMEVINEGERILLHMQEYDIERIIHMNADVRAPSEPSALGFSIGHWDGDDLVVNTRGIDWDYYDEAGVPQSLKATHEERFAISADGTELSYSIVITDPMIFTAPLTLQTTRRWQPGTKVEKYDCTAKWDVAEG